MSDQPKVVGDYKTLIYLTANDNIDDLEKLFNNKILQQEIKLFAEDISKENPSSSKKNYRNLGRIGILFSSIGFGTAGAAFSVMSSPIAIPVILMAIFSGMFANNLGEIFADDLTDVMTKLSNISGKNTNLPGNNYINSLEQNFQVLPYSSALGTLIFPPGHPMPNKFYRQHPLPDKKEYYMPTDYYYKILLDEKEKELIKILCDLGAKKIEIYEEKNALNNIAFEASAKLTSVVETEANISKENKSSQSNKRESSYIGKPWHPKLKDEFDSSNYKWLHYEPTWESIVHGRLTNGQLTATLELTTTLSKEEMMGLSLGISAEKIVLEKIGLSTSFLDSSSITTKRIFNIEFPGEEESKTVKSKK